MRNKLKRKYSPVLTNHICRTITRHLYCANKSLKTKNSRKLYTNRNTSVTLEEVFLVFSNITNKPTTIISQPKPTTIISQPMPHEHERLFIDTQRMERRYFGQMKVNNTIISAPHSAHSCWSMVLVGLGISPQNGQLFHGTASAQTMEG